VVLNPISRLVQTKVDAPEPIRASSRRLRKLEAVSAGCPSSRVSDET
jgi:hypothetical protein